MSEKEKKDIELRIYNHLYLAHKYCHKANRATDPRLVESADTCARIHLAHARTLRLMLEKAQ